jgi:cytochrome b6-f complex iron-sulfur subunit
VLLAIGEEEMSDRLAGTDRRLVAGRRNWLLAVLSGWIAITIGIIAFPVVLFLWPRKVTRSGELAMVVDQLDQLRAKLLKGEWPAPFDFGGKPCLLVITAEGAERLRKGVRLEPNDLRAFNALCTHTDCTVEFRLDQSDIFCACHNGRYNLDGRNISGPPPRPLEAYKVTLQETATPGEEQIVVSRT